VIRFWNNQVMNDIDGVIHAIIFAMEPEAHFYDQLLPVTIFARDKREI